MDTEELLLEYLDRLIAVAEKVQNSNEVRDRIALVCDELEERLELEKSD